MTIDKIQVAPIETKNINTEENTFKAYVAIFNKIDRDGDVVQPGAFKKTIQEKIPKRRVKFVDGHSNKMKDTHGVVLDAGTDKKGLWTLTKFATTKDSQRIKQKMADGVIDKYSYAYQIHEKEYGEFKGERVRFLKELEILEVTGAPIVVNDETELLSVKTPRLFMNNLKDELNLDSKGEETNNSNLSFNGGNQLKIGTKQLSELTESEIETIMGNIGSTMENALEARMENIRKNLEQDFSEEKVEELMGVIGGVLETKMNEAQDEIASELSGEEDSEEADQEGDQEGQSSSHDEEDEEKSVSEIDKKFMETKRELTKRKMESKYHIPDGQKGQVLGSELQELISQRVNENDQVSRADTILAIANSAGVETERIQEIINGEGGCPDIETLRGIAEVLDDAVVVDLVEAAKQDGCDYPEVESGTNIE